MSCLGKVWQNIFVVRDLAIIKKKENFCSKKQIYTYIQWGIIFVFKFYKTYSILSGSCGIFGLSLNIFFVSLCCCIRYGVGFLEKIIFFDFRFFFPKILLKHLLLLFFWSYHRPKPCRFFLVISQKRRLTVCQKNILAFWLTEWRT